MNTNENTVTLINREVALREALNTYTKDKIWGILGNLDSKFRDYTKKERRDVYKEGLINIVFDEIYYGGSDDEDAGAVEGELSEECERTGFDWREDKDDDKTDSDTTAAIGAAVVSPDAEDTGAR